MPWRSQQQQQQHNPNTCSSLPCMEGDGLDKCQQLSSPQQVCATFANTMTAGQGAAHCASTCRRQPPRLQTAQAAAAQTSQHAAVLYALHRVGTRPSNMATSHTSDQPMLPTKHIRAPTHYQHTEHLPTAQQHLSPACRPYRHVDGTPPPQHPGLPASLAPLPPLSHPH